MTRFLTLALILGAGPAMAHHPLNGLPMETFAQGAMSGLGHTVLGFDHLFFVLAVGIAAALVGRGRIAPLAYIAAMMLGCVLVLAGGTLPLRELMIALSLLVVGAGVAGGWLRSGRGLILLFAGFGLFHGAAFGASIAGQEGGAGMTVLAGYLLGLAAVQYVLTQIAGTLAGLAGLHRARLAGAMVAGAGILLCLELAEAPLLAMLIG